MGTDQDNKYRSHFTAKRNRKNVHFGELWLHFPIPSSITHLVHCVLFLPIKRTPETRNPSIVSGGAATSNAGIHGGELDSQVICVREKSNYSTYTKKSAWFK